MVRECPARCSPRRDHRKAVSQAAGEAFQAHDPAALPRPSLSRGRGCGGGAPADSKIVNVLSPPVSRDLVVVGAGIVGASVAYHAARAGAVVALVDAGRPGAGVTADSFAWIGASGVRTGPAAGLRATATEEYRRLEAELPGLPVTWSGSLTWGAEDGAPEAGPGQEIVDAATVVTLEPTLRQPPEWAVWAPGDGAVDPVGVTERLVAGARVHGARVHPDTPVTAVRRNVAGRVVGVETAAGPLSGATVVLAAGVATAALARCSAYASRSTRRRRRSSGSAPRPVWSGPWSTPGTSISGRSLRTGYLSLQTRPNGPSPPSGPPSVAPRASSCSAPDSEYAQCRPTASRSSARSPRCPASTWR